MPWMERRREERCERERERVCSETTRYIGLREKGTDTREGGQFLFPNVSFSSAAAFFRIHERVLPVTVIGFKGWFIKTGPGYDRRGCRERALGHEIFRRCNAA